MKIKRNKIKRQLVTNKWKIKKWSRKQKLYRNDHIEDIKNVTVQKNQSLLSLN